jgi:hypothetical protein
MMKKVDFSLEPKDPLDKREKIKMQSEMEVYDLKFNKSLTKRRGQLGEPHLRV